MGNREKQRCQIYEHISQKENYILDIVLSNILFHTIAQLKTAPTTSRYWSVYLNQKHYYIASLHSNTSI